MGEFVTRATVWLAVGFYVAACLARIYGCRLLVVRWLWSAGADFFIIHCLCAFHFFYDWSHAVAWEETARQTEEMTGNRSGFGIYLNYLFAAIWAVDAGWWWLRGDAAYANRAKWVSWLLHGFMFFMIVNGAVVFTPSPLRWVAAVLLAVVAISFLMARRGRVRDDPAEP